MRVFYGLASFCLMLLQSMGGGVWATSSLPADVGEGEIWVAGRTVNSLRQAFDYVTDDGKIHIGPGAYREAAVLRKSNVRITASKGAVIYGVAAEGKAALVIKGKNTYIEGIECHSVSVPDKNGACIRMEGENLTLKNVYFHDAEQGLLTHGTPGLVLVEDSRFERLGKEGQAHGIYVNGGELIIRRSWFLNSVDEGHEIKSRAEKTTIEYSVIASKSGNDSRLIDVPSGGIAVIRENLIVEGPETVNWEILSFGVEEKRYASNMMRLEKNLIITDRPGGSVLMGVGKNLPAPIVTGNIIVGRMEFDGWGKANLFYKSRRELKLPEAPELPAWRPSEVEADVGGG